MSTHLILERGLIFIKNHIIENVPAVLDFLLHFILNSNSLSHILLAPFCCLQNQDFRRWNNSIELFWAPHLCRPLGLQSAPLRELTFDLDKPVDYSMALECKSFCKLCQTDTEKCQLPSHTVFLLLCCNIFPWWVVLPCQPRANYFWHPVYPKVRQPREELLF